MQITGRKRTSARRGVTPGMSAWRVSRRGTVRSYITATVSITIVLFMTGIMMLILMNTRRLTDYVRGNVGFTLLIDDSLRNVDVINLQKMLNIAPFVRSAVFVDKEDAAVRLSADLGEDILALTGNNPLFSSVELKVNGAWMHPDSLANLEKKLMSYEGVNEVCYQRDLLDSVNANVGKAGLFVAGLTAVLLFLFVTLLNNTIRISVYSQRFIIDTMKLVGATRSFIRGPFIRQSIMLGLTAGLIADAAIFALISGYSNKLVDVAVVGGYVTMGIVFMTVLLLGVFISWISTFFSVNKFLRLTYDELFY